MISILKKNKRLELASRVPSRLLSSRLETRGLHPVGALARPHREEQEKQSQKKHTRTAARDARCAFVQSWMASPSARSFAWTSRSAWFSGPVPPPRAHPTGAKLITSASGAAELAAPVSRGRGAEVAFSIRRRVGRATWRSKFAVASSIVGGTGESAGC